MQIVEHRQDGTGVVALAGALDGTSAPRLAERAIAVSATGIAAMVIDMSEVPYITSAGFRALILILRHCQGAAMPLALCGLGEVVHDLFVAGGLLGSFRIYPDRAAAVAAIADQKG